MLPRAGTDGDGPLAPLRGARRRSLGPRAFPAASAGRPAGGHARLRAGSLLTAAALVVVGLASVPHPTRAQAAESARTERLRTLFSSLGADSRVRIVRIGGLVEEVRLGPVRDGSVGVSREGSSYSIDYPDVGTVALEGRHGIQGALWGLGAGALVGAFVGAVYASLDCQTRSGCSDSETHGALRGAALFGGLGAAVGFVVGGRQVHWHPVFP